jgi:hypothetical protein
MILMSNRRVFVVSQRSTFASHPLQQTSLPGEGMVEGEGGSLILTGTLLQDGFCTFPLALGSGTVNLQRQSPVCQLCDSLGAPRHYSTHYRRQIWLSARKRGILETLSPPQAHGELSERLPLHCLASFTRL